MTISISHPRLKASRKKKEAKSPPLFAWQPSQTLSPAARRLAARSGLSAATAALVASLAGLGQEGRANG